MKKFIVISVLCVLVSCSPKTFTVIQVADAQLGFDAAVKGSKPGATYVNDLTYEMEYLTKVVEKLNEIKPDVVVFTGDQVHLPKDAEQKDSFNKIVSQIDKSIKVFYLPGNHDVSFGDGAVDSTPFTDYFGEDRFVYSLRGITLVGVNSNLIMFGDPTEAEQKEWMENELSKGRSEDVKLVFGHHPFFVNDIEEEDSYHQIPKAKRTDYFKMFSENGVDAIYAGHLHESALGEYEGIPMRTTTSSAYQLGESKPSIRLITIKNAEIIIDELLVL